MKSIAPALFSVPQPPPRTQVPDAQAEAFVLAERPAAARIDMESVTTPIPPSVRSAPKTGMARLSVDVPCSTLRALKIRAIENGKTVREYVLAMLERDGLLD
jgi:hypothetical protein